MTPNVLATSYVIEQLSRPPKNKVIGGRHFFSFSNNGITAITNHHKKLSELTVDAPNSRF